MTTILYILYILGYILYFIKYLKDNRCSFTFYPYTLKDTSVYALTQTVIRALLMGFVWPIPIILDSSNSP